MSRSPKVSVVTPTYNRAHCLTETIESILDQSFQDFEYLIVDDGSDDGTRELVAGYADRIRYLFHDNRGEAASTNRGWEQAEGQYFAMVSSDDPMPPNWLESAITFMEANPDVLVGYPDWHMIDAESKVLRTVEVYEYSAEKLYGWVHCLPGPGALIRKSALSSDYVIRDPSYRFVSDLESWFRLGLIGEFSRIPQVLACWRLHEDSVSVSERSMQRSNETLRLVNEFYEREDLDTSLQVFSRMARSRANLLASIFVSGSHPLRAMNFFLRAIALLPKQPSSMPVEIRRPAFMRLFGRLVVQTLTNR